MVDKLYIQPYTLITSHIAICCFFNWNFFQQTNAKCVSSSPNVHFSILYFIINLIITIYPVNHPYPVSLFLLFLHYLFFHTPNEQQQKMSSTNSNHTLSIHQIFFRWVHRNLSILVLCENKCEVVSDAKKWNETNKIKMRTKKKKNKHKKIKSNAEIKIYNGTKSLSFILLHFFRLGISFTPI